MTADAFPLTEDQTKRLARCLARKVAWFASADHLVTPEQVAEIIVVDTMLAIGTGDVEAFIVRWETAMDVNIPAVDGEALAAAETIEGVLAATEIPASSAPVPLVAHPDWIDSLTAPSFLDRWLDRRIEKRLRREARARDALRRRNP